MSKLTMWQSDVDSSEEEELVVKGLGVGYVPKPVSKSKFFSGAEYNPDINTLTISTGDGREIAIAGFVSLDSLSGKRGIKGKKGKKGQKGKDGKRGEDGKDGCKGRKGKRGEQGVTGPIGETGDQGRTGNRGAIGPTGPDGEIGPTGSTGLQGKRGPQGAGCLTGSPGAIGLKPIENVVVQTNEPQRPNVHLWGEPDLPIYINDTDDVNRDPMEIEFEITPIKLDIRAPSIDGIDGTLFKGVGVSNIINFNGGVGPFNYEWSGDYEKQEGIVFTLTQRGRALSLVATANIPPKEKKEYKGKIYLKITDEGHPDRTTKTEEAEYFIEMLNPADALAYDPQVWQPREGAIVHGVRANHTNGRNIKVEELQKGETLVGLHIEGMPTDSTGDAWKVWEGLVNDSTSRKVSTTILQNYHGQTKAYIAINHDLKILPDKYLLYANGDVWRWKQAKDVLKGDLLYCKDGESRAVEYIEFVEEQVFTCAIAVNDPTNCFFLEGYLVHD